MRASLITVSVIVPIYNISEYLDICIRSICNQTYKYLEIILVDDGSTDRCSAICDEAARKDNRIRVIHKENGGLVSARKAGMYAAQGEYILNVDGDDWIECNMIERLLQKAFEDHPDIVQCGHYIEGAYTEKVESKVFSINMDGQKKNDELINWMTGNVKINSHIWSRLFKKNAFIQIYSNVPDDMSNGEDYVAYILSLMGGFRFSSIKDCLYHYREREDSLSRKKGLNLVVKEDILAGYILRIIKKEFSIPEDIINKWAISKKIYVLKNSYQELEDMILTYFFDGIDSVRNSQVVVYGAGKVGHDYVIQLSKYEDINIVAWVDQNYLKYSYDFRNVVGPECIAQIKYDYIIIAIKDPHIAHQIREEFILDYRIIPNKIIWNKVMTIWDKR